MNTFNSAGEPVLALPARPSQREAGQGRGAMPRYGFPEFADIAVRRDEPLELRFPDDRGTFFIRVSS